MILASFPNSLHSARDVGATVPGGGVPARARAKTVGKHRRSRAAAVPRLLPRALPVVRLRWMGTGRTRVAGSLSRLCRHPRLQQQNLRPWWPPRADQSHREHQLVTVPTPPQPRGRWGLGSGSGRPNRSCTSFGRPKDGQIGSSDQIMEMGALGPDRPAAPCLGWRQRWHQLSAMAANSPSTLSLLLRRL